mgnify:CR=1 FL=1
MSSAVAAASEKIDDVAERVVPDAHDGARAEAAEGPVGALQDEVLAQLARREAERTAQTLLYYMEQTQRFLFIFSKTFQRTIRTYAG